MEVTTLLSLALALESRYRKARRITLRTLRQGLGRPIFGKVIAIGLTLCLLNLDLAVALEAKRVLEPIAPKRVAPPALPKPSFLASLNTMLSQIIALKEQPPVAPAPGLPPAWGASAGVYGGVVNLGNGNLTLQLPLVGWSEGVGFTLVFNSQANPSQPSPIAPKWTHNWHVSLTLNSSQTQAILQEGDGSRWVYTDADGDGVFAPPTGLFDRLVRQSDGRYVLTRHGSEEQWVFGSSGNPRVLEQVVDKYGQAITLSYVNGQLNAVQDRYGRVLNLVYSNNRLWKVVDFIGREWELGYNAQGRLERVRFPQVENENGQPTVYEVVFGYNSRGNVVSWRDRLGKVWQYGYLSATSDVLKWFKDPNGNQWTAFYSAVQPVGIQSTGTPENGSSRWVDPTGVWVEYGFATPTVVRMTQGGNGTTLRLTTRLWRNGQYQVVKRQDPAGLVWEWNYDTDGKLLWSKEPNGAQTTYTYYPNSDRVWKITDALNHTWEYTYTSYGDVKSVQDPENATTSYVYDYELNAPAYGKVRKVIDPMGRETQYEYYGANDANLARRGQLKRVTVPGGFWREMDYGGAGWLVRREVQVASGSEVTSYTYDAWGRLRLIDYPRSADVSMGYDGENRRVWVQDGVSRREYTYDAWGRVRRQQGCCGSEPGIDVVAVSAEYDAAGRKRYERELNANDTPIRTIETTYDPLGRLQTIGDYRGQVVYSYDDATGRLQQEVYPNGSYVEYTYYGSDNLSQVGNVWKVEHKKADGSLLIGYEYTYDLLGRVVQSVEHRPDNPSGDTTVYTYTPAGRLASESRTGQVAYERQYAYNPDGSRQSVYRNDVLNGEHREFYEYDPVSGRLRVVEDRVNPEPPYPRHEFVWNPEGTLARWWNSEPNSYARVFGYDEEGRLTKIARDYGNGNLQTAYEYGYNADGVRVWKRDWLNQQEYRYLCRIGCGGVPMRVYNRAIGDVSWASVEDYLPAGNALGYSSNWRYVYSGGELLMMGASGEPSGYYPMDSNGAWVQSELPAPCKCPVFTPTAPSVCPPLGYGGCEGGRCDIEEDPPLPPWVYPSGGIPIYGNWCGPGHPHPDHRIIGDCERGGVRDHPPVSDKLDSCCCKHDKCYEQFNCNTLCGWLSCDCAICDGLLANCALTTFCGLNQECNIARTLILLYMGTVAWRCLLTGFGFPSGDGEPSASPPPYIPRPLLPGPTGPCGGLPCP